MTEFIQRAKLRLLYLAIGLALGLLIAGIVGVTYNEVMLVKEEAYIAQVKHLQELSELKIRETERLLAENKALRTKKVETTKPDGSKTVIEETEQNSSISSEERSREVQDLQAKVERLKEEYNAKLEVEKKKKPSLSVQFGYTTSLELYAALSYNVWGPLIIGGYADRGAEFGLGIGIQF